MKPQITETGTLRNLRGSSLGGAWRWLGQGVCLGLLGSLMVVAACATDDTGGPIDTREYALNRFANCDSLDDYLTDLAVDLFVQSYMYGGYYDVGVPQAGGIDDSSAPAEWDSRTDSGPSDYTTTNIQEEGVDELDVLKSNGQNMFYLHENVLHIYDSFPPAESHELATIALDGWGENLALIDNFAIAVTQISEGSTGGCDFGDCGEPVPRVTEPVDEPIGVGDEAPDPDVEPEPDYVEALNAARATIIDVSDPSAPDILHTLDFEGYLVSGRIVDGILYLIVLTEPAYYDPDLYQQLAALDLQDPWTMTPEELVAYEPEVRNMVTPIIADYIATKGRDLLIPDVRVDGGERTELLSCNQLMRPAYRSGVAVLSVIAVDPDAFTHSASGVVAQGWHVYGSENAIYIAQDSRSWRWPSIDQRVAVTTVHRFELEGGSASYVASGVVDGWVLNQFSMSEYDGYLRIATTDQTNGGWWWGPVAADAGVGVPVDSTTEPAGDVVETESEPEPAPEPEPVVEPGPDANNVFVLELPGMEQVGEVRGITPNEQIYAARFLGEVGYLVTFRQVDPLIVVDLSDPTSPEVRGMLHVPGYSSYLHPVGPNHLIGFGRNGTPEGQVLGIKLELFNVSDLDNPVSEDVYLVDANTSGWSWSEAEQTHHAVTWYGSRGLFAIPVTREDWTAMTDEYRYFSGLMVFHVSTETGFEEVGSVSHTGMVMETYCSDEARVNPEADYACSTFDYPWYAQMRRSAFVDDSLFAFSNVGVTVSGIEAIDEPVVSMPLSH